MLEDEFKKLLLKQHYKLVGNHSAVKLCGWTKKSIKGVGVCYKEKFYGIDCHRCLQFTPSVEYCNHRCVYCWRNIEHTKSSEMGMVDEPSEIIEEAERKHRLILTGFGGILDDINESRWRQAHQPNQAAISLAGEPTYYPNLGELISEFGKRGYTTYLVSNGTRPKMLECLSKLPTQLYVSVDAPDEKTYKGLCQPVVGGGWSKLNESLSLFPSLDTRKVLRLTLVEGLNIFDVKGYAKLIEKASPDFVEAKAYMFIGGSRHRLSLDNMPSHARVREFAEEISRETGYALAGEQRESRVVLLEK
ncbi:MAG: 4-demethylwyosine synthase TYW1 [Candidatus Altiarchaeales archaeon]|nr:4-demethylwyosine synthase TYW1 [Candidatus Altiarchaeales archaeon]